MKFPQVLGIWSALLLALALPACGGQRPQPELFRVLQTSWQSYRQQFISPEGRVVVPERDGGTISEAQAYALLRALWAGDKATFAKVYAWTYKNLAREDHLLSWLWGRRSDGVWGVLDANTASDGDLDFALALALAARRGWRPPPGLPDYLTEARQVLAGILEKEVVVLPNGALLLTPGNWHEEAPPYLLNPSYFSPAAYRLFSQINASHTCGIQIPLNPPFSKGDFEPPFEKGGQGGFEVCPAKPGITTRGYLVAHYDELVAVPVGLSQPLSPLSGAAGGGGEWASLPQSTYELLGRLNQGLGENPGVGLFPDWCRVDAQGQLSPAPGRETQFGWEAVRLPWRLALDSLWFEEPRAAQILDQKFLPFFKKEWQARGKLYAVYNYDGTPAVTYDSPVLYAGVLAAALAAGDRDFAGQLASKIQSFYYEKDGQTYFVTPDNYYANNWAWLGLALYAGWVKP